MNDLFKSEQRRSPMGNVLGVVIRWGALNKSH